MSEAKNEVHPQSGDLERFVMRPGLGWRHMAGPVYEHTSGARVHCGGLVRMPNGDHYHLDNWAESAEIREMIKINGGNRKRGMMAWVASQLAA